MTKDELIHDIHINVNGVTKRDIGNVLDAAGEAIRRAIGRNDEAVLPGLCKFVVHHQAARTARNPASGEAIAVPAKRVAKIKALKPLRDAAES